MQAHDAPFKPMDAAEFVRCGEMIFGSRWKKPLGRLIERSPRMVRFYVAGKPIPNAIALKLRQSCDLGELGTVIHDVLRQSAPEMAPYRCRVIASAIVEALTAARALTLDMVGSGGALTTQGEWRRRRRRKRVLGG